MKAIVIVSWAGSPWLGECLDSIGDTYPVLVCDGKTTFDPMGFYYAKQHNLDEFILWHDSAIVKNPDLFELFFSIPGHVTLMKGGLMCMGKYVTTELPELPEQPMTKHQAVDFESNYMHYLPATVLFPDLTDQNKFEDKNGRKNMVIENDFFRKYKGSWSIQQINELYGEA